MLLASQILFRLFLATLLSALIGIERETKHRPAGLRTNILVGLGSCLIVILSLRTGLLSGVDPTRIAAGVVTGIGFLGAGVIMRANNNEIQGITTAATIWIVSAIGMAVGFGDYFAAIATTVVVLFVLYVFGSEKLRGALNLDDD